MWFKIKMMTFSVWDKHRSVKRGWGRQVRPLDPLVFTAHELTRVEAASPIEHSPVKSLSTII